MGNITLGDGNNIDIGIGNYIKADKIAGGEIGVILDAGTMREQEFEAGKIKTVIDFKIELEGEEYTWTMNKQTLNALEEGYGSDCKKWIGKRVKLTKEKRNVFGEMKMVVFGEPIKGEEKVVEGKATKTVKI